MLVRTSVFFLVLSLLAGVVGVAGRTPLAGSLGQILFFLFLCGFVVLLLTGLATERDNAG